MESERWKERLKRRQVNRFTWAFRPLQNPTYDPEKGWKLDQFAMNCEPDLVVSHTLHLRERDSQVDDVFDQIWIDDSDLNRKIRLHLLEPRFVVKGIPRGLNHPEVIPVILLENLHVYIETSELVEVGDPVDGRHYEHVRVFESVGKSKGGRHRVYDWPKLRRRIEADGVRFASKQALIRFCRDNVLLAESGKRPKGNGPDLKTIKDAIKNHHLDFFINKS